MHNRFNLPSDLNFKIEKIKDKPPVISTKPGQKIGKIRLFNKLRNNFFTNENYDLIGEN